MPSLPAASPFCTPTHSLPLPSSLSATLCTNSHLMFCCLLTSSSSSLLLLLLLAFFWSMRLLAKSLDKPNRTEPKRSDEPLQVTPCRSPPLLRCRAEDAALATRAVSATGRHTLPLSLSCLLPVSISIAVASQHSLSVCLSARRPVSLSALPARPAAATHRRHSSAIAQLSEVSMTSSSVLVHRLPLPLSPFPLVSVACAPQPLLLLLLLRLVSPQPTTDYTRCLLLFVIPNRKAEYHHFAGSVVQVGNR